MTTPNNMRLSLACWLLLAAVWLGDLASPPLLVVAILLSIPVALSLGVACTRLTWQLVCAALVADVSAGIVNAYVAQRALPFIVLADRGLAALAIVLVGVVTVYAIRQSATASELADRHQRSELMRDLISALAHDLRTPLTAARLTLRQAYDGAYGTLPDQYREVLRRSIVSNEDVTRLAETLLTFARYEAGEQSSQREPVDVGALCTNVCTDLAPIFASRGVRNVVECGEAVCVSGDPSDLRRALTNVIANAAYNTPAGGSVSVAARTAGQYAMVSVDDDGYGVAEEMRPQLFERFVARAGQSPGIGLGLYIVRRIVEAHSGTIRYEPREPVGSSFTMLLPAPVERAAV